MSSDRYTDFYLFMHAALGEDWSTRDPEDIGAAVAVYIRDAASAALIVDPENLPDNLIANIWNSAGYMHWSGSEDVYIDVVRQHVLALGKFGIVDGFYDGRVDTTTPFDPDQNNGLGYRPGCIKFLLEDMVSIAGYSVVRALAVDVIYHGAIDTWIERHLEGRAGSTGKLRRVDLVPDPLSLVEFFCNY
jgi:hypothetical protein